MNCRRVLWGGDRSYAAFNRLIDYDPNAGLRLADEALSQAD